MILARRAIARTSVLLGTSAVLIVASFGVGYLAGGGGRSLTMMVTTVTTTTTLTATSGSLSWLELRVTDNASVLKVGQSLSVEVSLFNTLASTNSVQAPQDWPFEGVPVALWPTCYFPSPPTRWF